MSTQTSIDGGQVLNALANVGKKHRPSFEIQTDLDRAKAEHRKLMPLVESEGKRVAKQRDRIARAQLKWKVENPDDPFDPNAFTPPALPYVANRELTDRFHGLHYTIADFEKELELAQKARAAGVK